MLPVRGVHLLAKTLCFRRGKLRWKKNKIFIERNQCSQLVWECFILVPGLVISEHLL